MANDATSKETAVKMFLLMRAYQEVHDNFWVMQGILY
jgi:hypothetical protein